MQHSFGEDSITVVQGSSRDFTVLLRYKSGKSFDLSGVTVAKAFFPGRPLVQITMADNEIEIIEPKSDGEMVLSLSSVKTKLLSVEQRQSFEIEFTKGSKTHVIQFKEMLDVERRLV